MCLYVDVLSTFITLRKYYNNPKEYQRTHVAMCVPLNINTFPMSCSTPNCSPPVTLDRSVIVALYIIDRFTLRGQFFPCHVYRTKCVKNRKSFGVPLKVKLAILYDYCLDKTVHYLRQYVWKLGNWREYKIMTIKIRITSVTRMNPLFQQKNARFQT